MRHKHRWQVGTDKYGEPEVYFVDEDGDKHWAEVDGEWRREVEEQLCMVYVDSERRWYDKEEVPEPDEAYGWREVESSYYRDVL